MQSRTKFERETRVKALRIKIESREGEVKGMKVITWGRWVKN